MRRLLARWLRALDDRLSAMAVERARDREDREVAMLDEWWALS